jgi:exosortase
LEHSLSQPLQRIATVGSVWVLQTLGQPAFAEGNTIVLGAHHLEVERACAGLRIFVGVVGIAYAWTLIGSGTWLRRVLLLASSLVVAVVANIGRIVVTSLCFQYASPEFAQRIAHDVAGWFMIPAALLLVAFVSWYLSRLFVETRSLEIGDIVRGQRS